MGKPNIVRSGAVGAGETKGPHMRPQKEKARECGPEGEKKSPLAGAWGYFVRVETSIPNSRRAETMKVWALRTCSGRDS